MTGARCQDRLQMLRTHSAPSPAHEEGNWNPAALITGAKLGLDCMISTEVETLSAGSVDMPAQATHNVGL